MFILACDHRALHTSSELTTSSDIYVVKGLTGPFFGNSDTVVVNESINMQAQWL